MTPRRFQSQQVRRDAADLAQARTHGEPLSNGDEGRYRLGADHSYIGNFTKGLNHNSVGHVVPSSYRKLVRALETGSNADFEAIPLGGTRKFVNPQAGFAFDLQGPDTGSLSIPPAPALNSAEIASEMAELYWMAIHRDLPFRDYSNANVGDAVNNLNSFSDFRGPKEGGAVTVDTLFRGITSGDLAGPYISQFLWLPVVFGTLRTPQRQLTALAGHDFLQDFSEWLNVQNGAMPPDGPFDSFRRYIRSMRELATYVHFDALYEAYLNACLILLDLRAPFDGGNPYRDSATQDGFGTLGGPHVLSLVCEVATRALKSVWRQKWIVHRRLRPEAYGGLVHNQLSGAFDYGDALHPEILATGPGTVADAVHAFNLSTAHDTFLLPMAFPEGSPTHPAYGAGHATVAGACTTILKAWFDEEWHIPSPVEANSDGLSLAPWGGAPLTVGGELNKLCANISIGRNAAGVHWRTDYTASIKLGEQLAIGILEEQKLCYNERFSFSLTKFDGSTIQI